MLNIGGLNQGVVIDHIKAGHAMQIYHYLNLEKLDCSVAIIKNAKSNKMGKKDIIKIEGPLCVDLDILGVLDDNITINIIENEKKFGEFKYMMFYNSLLELLKKIDCPEDLINIIMNSVNNVHAEVEEKFPTAKAARTCGNQMLEDVVDEIVFNVLTKNSYKE